MVVFAVRRLLQALVAIILTTFLVYLGLFVWRDPFAISDSGRVVPADIQHALRAKFGMDRPFFVRYLVYLKNLFTGDLGIDFQYRRPVTDMVFHAVPKTVGLVVIALGAQAVIGLAAGVYAAVTKRPFRDALVTTSMTVLFCVPVFVVGVFLRTSLSGLRVFGVEVFAIVPHRFTIEYPWYTEALLPGLCVALVGSGIIARVCRSSVLEAMSADYIQTARAKGITERRVIVVHALRNALIPVVTLFGIEFGALLGGAFIVEGIFDYPGVGFLGLKAIQQDNDPVIMAVTVYSLIAFILLSAIVDVLYARLDPRIRIN
jgi:oligopeptide transport system permease protein